MLETLSTSLLRSTSRIRKIPVLVRSSTLSHTVKAGNHSIEYDRAQPYYTSRFKSGLGNEEGRRFVMAHVSPSGTSSETNVEGTKSKASMKNYSFPTQRLKKVLNDSSRTPLGE